VRALARSFNPDVVHGHATKGGMLARAVPNGPWQVVYTPHAVFSMNPLLSRRVRSGVDAIERSMANRTDTVIAVSPEEETHLRLMGIEPDKIRMIPNGIPPLERPDPKLVRRALGLPLDRPVIGFVGRLDGQKAPHILLNMFKEVAVARPNVDFVVVGDGPLRDELRQRAHISRCLRGRVHLVGEQPGPWAMAGMDVLALPSRYEGMPYVLIEAAHLGLPMVVTRAAGSALLQTGPSTILVHDVGDVRGLAGSCIGLVDQWPDLPDAPDHRFTLERMTELTDLVYKGRALDLDAGAGRAQRNRVTSGVDDAAATSAANGTGSLPVIDIDAADETDPNDAEVDLDVDFADTQTSVPASAGDDAGVEDDVPAVIDLREAAGESGAAARRRHLRSVPTWGEADPLVPETGSA
jgi:hypothetical protein